MDKFNELFGGEFTATEPDENNDEWQLTDANYHFCTVYDALAHDDGKAGERALYIAEAVNNYGRLKEDNAKLSQRIYEHNCRVIGAPIPKDT